MEEEQKTTAPGADKSRNKPLASEYFAMGTGKGISVAVWPTYVQLLRKERDENSGEWKTTQEFALAPMMLERLMIRFSSWFEMMSESKQEK